MDRNDVSQLIVDAFALKNAHGTDLLESLGTFDLWNGELSQMRGDRGRERTGAGDAPLPANVDRFQKTFAMSRSIGLLQPRCAEVLDLHYLQDLDAGEIAKRVETTERYAEKLIRNCTHRLLELADTVLAANVEEAELVSSLAQESEPVFNAAGRR